MEIIAFVAKDVNRYVVAIAALLILILVWRFFRWVYEDMFGLGIRLWDKRPRIGNYIPVRLARSYGGFRRGTTVWVQPKKLLTLSRHGIV